MFDAVRVLLENKTISGEVATALDSEISTQLSTLRDEAKGYRLKNEELIKSFDGIKETNIGLESKLSGFDESIKQAKLDGKSEVVTELEAERESTLTLQEQLGTFEKQNNSLRVENALNAELGKYKVRADLRDGAMMQLQASTKLDDKGLSFGDGLSLEEGVKGFFDTRASYLEATGTGGGQDNSGGGSSNQAKGNFGGDSGEHLQAVKAMMEK